MLLLKNANIVTCDHYNFTPPLSKPKLLQYTWLVCDIGDSGKIIDIGSDKERVVEWEKEINDEKTGCIIDGKNRLVLPGLWDAHCHVYTLGKVLCKVADLSNSSSIADMQARLTQKLNGTNGSMDKYCLEGVQWDQEELGRFPSRIDLDIVTTNHPIICFRRCWHVAVVNSKALEMCNIGSNCQDPGVIIDPITGEPTGILEENAMNLLQPITNQEEDDKEKKRLIQTSLDMFTRYGVTSVQTNDSKVMGSISNAWEMYSEVMESRIESQVDLSPLPCRVFLTISWEELCKKSITENDKKPKLSKLPDYLRSDRIKLVLDGGLGARTAALTQPYADDPSNINVGTMTMTPIEIKMAFDQAYRTGYRLEAHAIGDRAFEVMLTALQQQNTHPRPIITHCQILNPKILERINIYNSSKKCKIIGPLIADIQPQFCTSDSHIVFDRLGETRIKSSYIWQTMAGLGCILAGGSDTPVETPCALQGMRDAMSNIIHPDGSEDLSQAQALAMYTIFAAYSAKVENNIGRLAIGYAADFVLLHLKNLDDLFISNKGTDDLSKSVQMTFIGGRCAYDQNKEDLTDEMSNLCLTTGNNGPGKSGIPSWMRSSFATYNKRDRPMWQCPCCRY